MTTVNRTRSYLASYDLRYVTRALREAAMVRDSLLACAPSENRDYHLERVQRVVSEHESELRRRERLTQIIATLAT